MSAWMTYIVECSDGSYYVGIAKDPTKRVLLHNAGRGARWTRDRRPVVLRHAEKHPNKSAARKREIELKGWRREKKKALFESRKHRKD